MYNFFFNLKLKKSIADNDEIYKNFFKYEDLN